MRIKQSICYPLFMPANGDLEVLVREAASIGYRAIELWARPPDLDAIVALAQRRKSAIAIGHPYPATFEALQSCAPAILAGVEVVGADHLANPGVKTGIEVVDADHLANHGVKK